jgi:hypothetical protein
MDPCDFRRMGWAGHVARMVGKPEDKRPLGRRRRGWNDNIKMNLSEIMLESED